MSKIIFIYRENKYEIILKDNILDINIFEEYSKKIDGKINDLLFLYKGKNISFINSQQIFNKFKYNKDIIISVYNININNKIENISENFICPECKNLTFLNFNDDNINNSKNKYTNDCSYKYASISRFMNKQMLDENAIKCSICNNKKYLYGNNFYICSCKKKLCELCINKHKKNSKHNLIYFKQVYNICIRHLTQFFSYCSFCNLNLCEKCEEDHIFHKNKIIIFKKEMPNEKRRDEMKKEIDLIISNMKQYKKEIYELKDLFNYLIVHLNNDLDNYIKLYNKMLLLLDNLSNYQNIKNILSYKNININKDINLFLNENIKNKMKYLMNKLSEYLSLFL